MLLAWLPSSKRQQELEGRKKTQLKSKINKRKNKQGALDLSVGVWLVFLLFLFAVV